MKQILVYLFILASASVVAQEYDTVDRSHTNNFLWVNPQPIDLKGKTLVIDFWATWCAPCISGFDKYNKLVDTNANKDIVFLTITDEPIQKVKNVLKRIEVNAHSVIDPTNKWYKDIKIEAIPYSIVVDKKGKVVWQGNPELLSTKLIDSLHHSSAPSIDTPMDIKGFMKVVKDKSIDHFTYATQSDKPSLKVKFGNNVFLQGSSLQDIYKSIFNIELVTTDSTTYDVVYINKGDALTESESIQQMNDALGIKLNTRSKKINTHALTVQHPSKMDKYHAPASSQGDIYGAASSKSIDDHIIVGNNISISELADLLNQRKSDAFIYDGKDENHYNFIIKGRNVKELIASLSTYGIKCTKVQREVVEHYVE